MLNLKKLYANVRIDMNPPPLCSHTISSLSANVVTEYPQSILNDDSYKKYINPLVFINLEYMLY